MAELRRLMTMTDAELAYREIAALFEETFGERIRAGVEWVAPLFHSCTIGVGCDPNVAKCDAHRETIARTTEALATIFYGREQTELLRRRTASMRRAPSKSGSTENCRRVPRKP